MVRQHHHGNVWLTLALAGLALASPGGSVLAADAVSAGMAQPLTAAPGDAKRGEAIAADANRGNCVICHVLPIAGMQADAFGDIGPPLAGIGARLTVPQLRQRVADAKAVSPDTVMPSYFVTEGLTRVDPKYAGKTILSAQEVEDLVAYLATLK